MLGFLGLTIMGIAYQFYPPAIGTLRGASDRTARVSIGTIAGGLLFQVIGFIEQVSFVIQVGKLLTFIGTLMYAYLLIAVFQTR